MTQSFFRLKKNLVIYIINIILFLTIAALYHPGLITQDSIDSLAQALRLKEMSDWHPVPYALLLRFTTFKGTLFYLYLQVAICSVMVTYCLEYLTNQARLPFRLKLFLIPVLAGYIILSPPSAAMILTIGKDTLFSYLFLFGIFNFTIFSMSQDKSYKFLVCGFLACGLGTLLRHNGIIIFIGLSFLLLLVNTIEVKKLDKKLLLVVILGLLGASVLSFAFKSLSAPGMKLGERFSLTRWTLRSDYTLAYLSKFMDEKEGQRFENIIDVKKIVYFKQDSYIISWPDLPLKEGHTEDEFYKTSKDYLTSHLGTWFIIKLNYFRDLISYPVSHSILLWGDSENIKAQQELDLFQNHDVNLVLNEKTMSFRNYLQKIFGMTTGPLLEKSPGFFYSIWRFRDWLIKCGVLLLLFFILTMFIDKKFKRIVYIGSLYILGGQFLVWGPYIFFTLANQARYFYLTPLIVKLQFSILVITLISLVRKKINHKSFQEMPA